jgi:hypothetical protein
MTVSQESLVLEARIADDDARLAELNARHKAVCSWTGDRRPRELGIIERQIRDTTKHKTEHQQRLRRISNAPPPHGDSSNLSGQQHNAKERKEPRPSAIASAQRALDDPSRHSLMTAEEVSCCTRLSNKTVYEHPKLERRKMGRSVRFTTKSVIELLKSSTE